MKIENAPVEHYGAYLKDKYRPPSKGGNTGAWHQHVLTIGGEKYSFLARGSRKWVFASDLVSFEWDWDETKQYRNIKPETVVAKDKGGKLVRRGDRTSKPWRTAETRMPASRREQRD
jgi:hypothetical protein